MIAFPIEVGSVVISKAGRDRGRPVRGRQRNRRDFVNVANGKLRGMEHLKKKRRKHLKPTGSVIGELRDRLALGQRVENHEVRSWLEKEADKLVQV